MRLAAVVELGLALIFLGRSLTRVYFVRAVAQFGAAAVPLARQPDIEVIPTWVSVVLLSGWGIAAVGAVTLVLT